MQLLLVLENNMMFKNIALMTLTFSLTSCFLQPDKISENKSSSETRSFGEKVTPSSIAAKNFLQINNTYSSLTGVPAGNIAADYEQVKMQLPSSSNPESLNGFNQIASTRLGFLYCDEYIDGRTELNAMSNAEASRDLIESFIDADIDDNDEHRNLYNNVMAIMNDDDNLVDDGNEARKKTKLLKLSCTALLASSYITLI